jgi:hypothetical protein
MLGGRFGKRIARRSIVTAPDDGFRRRCQDRQGRRCRLAPRNSEHSVTSTDGAVARQEMPTADLFPDAARVRAVDAALRQRLDESFAHLDEVVRARYSAALDFSGLRARIRSGPLSPWVFMLYSKLVMDLSKDAAGRVADTFDDIVRAADLPAESGVIGFHESAIPDRWWDHFVVLFDTDRHRRLSLQAPTPAEFSICRDEIGAMLAFMKTADPVLYHEVVGLLRMVVLAQPGDAESSRGFGGASTFFAWGGALLNCQVRRSMMDMVDVLVHESSHLLLFGLSADEPLTSNSEEKHASPLRSDKRPIDGIFHACFVATRVHLAIERLLASGAFSPEQNKEAVDRRDFNGAAAREALQVLTEHARTTATGERILSGIREYWSNKPAS